jgi:hypothetical protein
LYGAAAGVPAAFETDVEEVPMMSLEEFRELQQSLQGGQPTRLPDGTVGYTASFRRISDHEMKEYRREIRELLVAAEE